MKNKKLYTIVAAVLFSAGVLLAAMGANAGENQVIMNKGVVVCTECIGIGDKLFPPLYSFVWLNNEEASDTPNETPKATEKANDPTGTVLYTKPTANPIL